MDLNINQLISGGLIAVIPPAVHGFSHLLEKMPFLGHKYIREQMGHDQEDTVKAVGRSEDKFKSIATYFDYERQSHFIFTILLSGIISLFVVQYQITHSVVVSTLPTLIVISLFSLGIVVLLIRILRGTYPPAAKNPFWRWTIGCLAAVFLVVIIEICLTIACARPGAANIHPLLCGCAESEKLENLPPQTPQ
jgi:hypothetical protein